MEKDNWSRSNNSRKIKKGNSFNFDSKGKQVVINISNCVSADSESLSNSSASESPMHSNENNISP